MRKFEKYENLSSYAGFTSCSRDNVDGSESTGVSTFNEERTKKLEEETYPRNAFFSDVWNPGGRDLLYGDSTSSSSSRKEHRPSTNPPSSFTRFMEALSNIYEGSTVNDYSDYSNGILEYDDSFDSSIASFDEEHGSDMGKCEFLVENFDKSEKGRISFQEARNLFESAGAGNEENPYPDYESFKNFAVSNPHLGLNPYELHNMLNQEEGYVSNVHKYVLKYNEAHANIKQWALQG